MKYVSHNNDGVNIQRAKEVIKVSWSNIMDFSTSSLWNIQGWKIATFIFAILGVILGVMVFDASNVPASVVNLFMGFICPMVAAIACWYKGVKPYKKQFDENNHTITLKLRDGIDQTFTCGSQEDAKNIFEEMKDVYQINKLKS